MSRNITYAEALGAALRQAMQEDPSVILLGEDIVGGQGLSGSGHLGGAFGVTKGLGGTFGLARVIDTPISESAFTGMALGASMTGLRPVVEIMFNDFVTVCFDPIVNQIAKTRFLSGAKIKTPLVIRTTMGAGDSSGAMHSQSLAHLCASIPGLKVVMPSTPDDAASMLLAAIQSDDPVIFFEHKGLYGVGGNIPNVIKPSPLNKAKVLRGGSDMTIVASGRMVGLAEQAAGAVESDGISCEVIDLRSIAPLDSETIALSVEKTGHLIIVDEGAARFGVASEIAAQVQRRAFGALRSPVQMIASSDTPVPYAPNAEAAYLPSEEKIIHSIKTVRD